MYEDIFPIICSTIQKKEDNTNFEVLPDLPILHSYALLRLEKSPQLLYEAKNILNYAQLYTRVYTNCAYYLFNLMFQ
jgi:hypothetical protein